MPDEKKLIPYTDPADIHETESGIPGYRVPSINAILRLHASDFHPVPGWEARELAQKILDLIEKARDDGSKAVSETFELDYLLGALDDIEEMCKEQLKEQ